MDKKIKSQNYTVTLYTDNESDKLKLEYIKLNYNYAYILHDKDIWTKEELERHIEKEGKEPNWKPGENKKEHIHVNIYLNSQRNLETIAKELNIEENRIEVIKDIRKMTRYLIHLDDKQKYQYDVRDIYTNIYERIQKYLKNQGLEQEDIKKIYEFIYRKDSYIYFSEVLDFVIFNNIYASFRRGISIIKELITEHNKLYLQKEQYQKMKKEEMEKEIWEYEKQNTIDKAKNRKRQ